MGPNVFDICKDPLALPVAGSGVISFLVSGLMVVFIKQIIAVLSGGR